MYWYKRLGDVISIQDAAFSSQATNTTSGDCVGMPKHSLSSHSHVDARPDIQRRKIFSGFQFIFSSSSHRCREPYLTNACNKCWLQL